MGVVKNFSQEPQTEELTPLLCLGYAFIKKPTTRRKQNGYHHRTADRNR